MFFSSNNTKSETSQAVKFEGAYMPWCSLRWQLSCDLKLLARWKDAGLCVENMMQFSELLQRISSILHIHCLEKNKQNIKMMEDRVFLIFLHLDHVYNDLIAAILSYVFSGI